MSIEQATALLHATIRTALLLAAPMLATAMLTGLIVSVLQAATQVNEQTLSFVPKIVLTLVVFAAIFPWMMATLVDFGGAVLAQAAAGAGP